MAAPFDAKALYEYRSEHADDLSFSPEQIIHVTTVEDDEWYSGWYDGPSGRCEGMFPKNYVEVLPAVPVPPRPQSRPSHARTKSVVEAQQGKHEGLGSEAKTVMAAEPQHVKEGASASTIQTTAEAKSVTKTELTEKQKPAPNQTTPAPSSSKPSARSTDSTITPSQQAALLSESPSDIPVPSPSVKSGNAFKDRIAAFNKTESAPIAPRVMAKPMLAKKPFVAPPPSKDYIPQLPPKVKPATVEISPAEVSSKSIAVPDASANADEVAPPPKIGSLKDRIAALQAEREQLAAKQSSAKAPEYVPEGIADGHDAEPNQEHVATSSSMQPLTRTSTARSMESHVSADRPLSRQPSARIGSLPTVKHQAEELMADTHESQVSPTVPDEHETLTGDAEPEADEEEQRKQRLRERMARMSGMGMGMHMALGLPTPAAKPRATKAEEIESATSDASVPVPSVPMPGLPSAPPSSLPLHETAAEEEEPRVQEPGDSQHVSVTQSAALNDGAESDNELDIAGKMGSIVAHEQTQTPVQPGAVLASSPTIRSPLSPSGRRPSYFGPATSSTPLSPTAPRSTAPPAPQLERPTVPRVPTLNAQMITPRTADSSAPTDSEREGYEADADDDPDAQAEDDMVQDAAELDVASVAGTTQSNMSPVHSAAPMVPPVPRSAVPPPVPSVPATPSSPRAPAPAPPPPQASVPISSTSLQRPAAPAPPLPAGRAPPLPTLMSAFPGSDSAARDSHEDQSSANEAEQLPELLSHSKSLSSRKLSIDSRSRHSMEGSRVLQRQSNEIRREHDEIFLASDLQLGSSQDWALQPGTVPPSLAQRQDVILNLHEHRNQTDQTFSKAISVLYSDYSQTVVSATINADRDVHIDQIHHAPPVLPSREKLEAETDRFGRRLMDEAKRRINTTVGSGEAHAFVADTFKGVPELLPPIGMRTFGVPIYINIGNASVTVHDEIRPGDIIAFRNAKFTGHKGAMKSKYSQDVGKPDHCGIVIDWDGTKKKVRVFEQGREGKKVCEASFKLKDLKSGEVKVFRPVSRQYCGWSD